MLCGVGGRDSGRYCESESGCGSGFSECQRGGIGRVSGGSGCGSGSVVSGGPCTRWRLSVSGSVSVSVSERGTGTGGGSSSSSSCSSGRV